MNRKRGGYEALANDRRKHADKILKLPNHASDQEIGTAVRRMLAVSTISGKLVPRDVWLPLQKAEQRKASADDAAPGLDVSATGCRRLRSRVRLTERASSLTKHAPNVAIRLEQCASEAPHHCTSRRSSLRAATAMGRTWLIFFFD